MGGLIIDSDGRRGEYDGPCPEDDGPRPEDDGRRPLLRLRSQVWFGIGCLIQGQGPSLLHC